MNPSDDAQAAGAQPSHPANPSAPYDLYFLEPAPEPITPERESELRQQATKFHQLYEDLNSSFYDYDNFYVVSMKWLKRWKVYTSYDEVIKGAASSKFIGAGELPILNEDIIDNDFEISIVFEEPYLGLNMAIVEGLKSDVDYVLVNKPIWQILQQYKNLQFNRKMVEYEEGKKVEVYYRRITAILLSNEILKDVEKETVKKFKKVNLQLPQYQDVEPLIPYISEKVRDTLMTGVMMHKLVDYSSNDDLKIWLADEDLTDNKLRQTFYKGCKANRSFSYKLHFPGSRVNLSGTTLSKLQFSPKTLICFELKEKKEEWVFFTKETPLFAKCDYCKSYGSLAIFCSCMYACYCSKDCKNKDKSSHKIRCDREAESSEDEKKQELNEYSKKGRMGLSNLGNTCFMNSGIQCITSIESLTEYFFTKAFVPEINTSNPLGTKGELSTAYGKLVQKMWCGAESYVSPSVLKRAIGKFQPMFVGYEQHDSGELISYLLDGLHEDLNRIKVKPYVETKNHDGRPDHVLSKEGWEGFLQRNQSKIVDLLFGQYKSKLHCPKCNNESITFDPFMMYPLPIPQSDKKVMEIILMKNHVDSTKLNVVVDKSGAMTLQTVIDQLAEKYKIPNRMLVSGSSYYSCQVFENTKDANEIRKEYKHKHILFRPLTAEENEKDQLVNIQHSLCHSQYGNESYRRNITYQRAYLFNKSMTTKDIHLRLFSFYKSHLKVEDYEDQIIKAPAADQRWRIHIVSNSRFDACFFCAQTGCENCNLPFSDEITLGDLLAKIKPGRTEHKFELEIYWRKGDSEVEKAFEKIDKESGGSGGLGDQAVEIRDCFKLAQEPEQLDAENEWYCPTCQQFVLAIKQLTLYKAPKVLICYFKRFKGKGYKGMITSKLSTHIDFPLQDLDINQFLVDKQLPGVYTEGANQAEHNVKYDLFAVSNHYGGLGGGHYSAFAKKDGEWNEYDDSSVRPADKAQIVSSAAYVLFYKRRDV